MKRGFFKYFFITQFCFLWSIFKCESLCCTCQSISAKNRIKDSLPVTITEAKSVLKMLYTVCLQVLGADQSVAAGESLLNGFRSRLFHHQRQRLGTWAHHQGRFQYVLTKMKMSLYLNYRKKHIRPKKMGLSPLTLLMTPDCLYTFSGLRLKVLSHPTTADSLSWSPQQDRPKSYNRSFVYRIVSSSTSSLNCRITCTNG